MTLATHRMPEPERLPITSSGGPRWYLASRWLLTATAVVALAVAAAVVLLLRASSSPSQAVTALDQAASASAGAYAPATDLSKGRSWYAEITLDSVLPLAAEGPTNSGSATSVRTVQADEREQRDIWLAANGNMVQRTAITWHLLDPAGLRAYRSALPHSVSLETSLRGHGLLASPLLPGIPLLSYHQLVSLPTDPAKLRLALFTLEHRIDSASTTPVPDNASATALSTIQRPLTATSSKSPIGSCCGTTSETSRAVGDLTTITALMVMPVSGQVRGALYRLAAALPGVHYVGVVHVGRGRTGTEVTAGTGPSSMRLVFDERTGMVLAISVGFGGTAAAEGFGTTLQTIGQLGAVISPAAVGHLLRLSSPAEN